jgi:hypothetical protein
MTLVTVMAEQGLITVDDSGCRRGGRSRSWLVLLLTHFGAMGANQSRSRVPNVEFRVLVIGRANAGKTSLLQRVCDTTESPETYRRGPWGTRERVRFSFLMAPPISSSSRLNSTQQQRLGMPLHR